MKKLKSIIEKAYDCGKLPKGFTPYMVWRLIDIYNALIDGKNPTFFELQINDLLNKCGIKTKTHGIGWIAYK